MSADQRIHGIALPTGNAPATNYPNAVRAGNLLVIAGKSLADDWNAKISISAMISTDDRHGRIAIFALCMALLLSFWNAEVDAQSLPVIGYVSNETANPERLEIFKKGLADTGYVEGQNISIEYRQAKLDSEYAGLMSELVAGRVTVILAANAPAAVAAARATRVIPIVLAAVNDPVGLGLVNSLERPGTNVTGTTNYAPQLVGERLRILKSTIPALSKISMFVNGNNANNKAQFMLLSAEAKALGVEVQLLDVRTPSDISPAFAKAVSFGTQGLFNCVDSFINSQRFVIARLASQYNLPSILTDREYVLAGGLMSLGVGHQEGYYRAAEYVAKILRGAKPSELSVALSTDFVFSVSRSAQNNLGLTLSKDINARVNEWLP